MNGVSYQRPVMAKLIVRLDNGEEWEAGPEDLKRFDLAKPLDLYVRTDALLREAFGVEDWDDHPAGNLVRYLVECGICYRHSPWANDAGEPWARDEDDDGPTFLDEFRAAFDTPALVGERAPDPGAGTP